MIPHFHPSARRTARATDIPATICTDCKRTRRDSTASPHDAAVLLLAILAAGPSGRWIADAVHLRSEWCPAAVALRSPRPANSREQWQSHPTKPSAYGHFRPCSLAFADLRKIGETGVGGRGRGGFSRTWAVSWAAPFALLQRLCIRIGTLHRKPALRSRQDPERLMCRLLTDFGSPQSGTMLPRACEGLSFRARPLAQPPEAISRVHGGA